MDVRALAGMEAKADNVLDGTAEGCYHHGSMEKEQCFYGEYN